MLVIGASRGLGKEITNVFGCDGISSAELDLAYPERVLDFMFKDYTHIIYNAGVGYDDIVTNIHYDRLEKMTNVNLVSPMLVARQFIRNCLAYDHGGSITFITSVSAHKSFKGLCMYGATNAGLEVFSRGVANEWASKNIRANCVSPGFMNTDMTKGLAEEKKKRIKHWTDPVDVINIIDFIIHSNVTGQTYII